MTALSNVIRIELDISQYDDKGVEELIGGIQGSAPNSPLYNNNASIKTAVLGIDSLYTAYMDAGQVVVTDRTKLVNDEHALAQARAALVTGVIQLKGLVETTAKSEGDVKTIGFTPLERQHEVAIKAPTGIDIFYPKMSRGRAKTTVQETGTRKRYDAQYCVGSLEKATWIDLEGDGRSHWFKQFPSATVVWVRYRTVRGHLTSAWSSPVSVTIP